MVGSARISSAWSKVFGKDVHGRATVAQRFFTASLRVAEKRPLVDAAIVDNIVQL